jgi:Lrp/AsnC family transcriptional regulator for asnA, asnC and gidA
MAWDSREIRRITGAQMRMQQRGTAVDLDALDLGIVRYLVKDPRTPVSAIAHSLRAAESTVRNRIARLTQSGAIAFALTTDPYKFGFSVWAMLEIQVEPARIRAVADLIRREPRVHMVGIMSGSYDIFAATVLRTNHDLFELITNRLSKISGITRISSSTMLEMVKRRVDFGLPELVYVGVGDRSAQTRRRGKSRFTDLGAERPPITDSERSPALADDGRGNGPRRRHSR